MRSILTFAIILLSFTSFAGSQKTGPAIPGEQPNAAIDTKGVVRIVFGKGEGIYCLTSANGGASFSSPVLVAALTGMHLGHSRGPQIASSGNYSMITAMDKAGNIHAYLLSHQTGKWKTQGNVNDSKGSAPEGLMALTADKEDNFYAIWLDTRLEQQNNIYLSKVNGGGKWSENKLVYRSPQGHVCECCKPGIAFNAGKLVITFRNWLMDSRDIYYMSSVDKGRTFAAAKKAGTGTWKLNGCPMDGGGLSVNDKGLISTVWQRNGELFFWSENGPEVKIASGRGVDMTRNGSDGTIAWQTGGNIQVMKLKDKATKDLGKGSSARIYALSNGQSLCVWEENQTIRYTTL
jgi:hypothetical protein